MSEEELDKFVEETVGNDIKIPKIEIVSVEDISVDGVNPNKMDTKKFEALKKNIEKYGFLNPVITNKDLLIADGEHRFLAAKELGMKDIPVFRLDVSDVDRRILRQVLNKLHGEHDKRLDFEEFKNLMENNALNLLEGLLGSEDKYLVQFVAGMQKDGLNPDEVPDVISGSAGGVDGVKVVKGDVWKLGDHVLLCGDATELDAVNKLVGDQRVDMVFTDPPYNINYDHSKKSIGVHGKETVAKHNIIKNDSMSSEDFKEFVRKFLDNLFLVNKGAFYICMSNKELPNLINKFQEAGGHWSSTIIWNKNHFTLGAQDYQRKYEPILYGFKENIEPTYEPILYGWPEGNEHYFNGDRTQSDVWDVEKPVKNDLHPTMKPVALIERAIVNSTKPEMIVLDLFGGSGSTMIAAERLNRKCLMMELDEHFCEVIIARWQNLTNKKAEKL